jgi:site-specific DNA recombinase
MVTTRKLPPLIAPEEAAAIRKAFEDYSTGANAHQIAREWNTARYIVRSTKGLTHWQPETVRDILKNRLYAGYVRHGDEYRRGLHEPIVSEELFWAAQREVRRISRRTHPPKLLRGIATCIEGHPLRVQPSRNSKKNPFSHYYYRESSDDVERPCSQSGKLWTTKGPDAQVEALFQTFCNDPGWLSYIDEQAKSSPHRSNATERSRVEAKLERLQGEYIEGRLPKDRWDRIFSDCQAELASLTAVEQPFVVVQAKLETWHDLWDKASPESRNEICRLVFEKAVIDFIKRELTLVPWPEFQPLFGCRAHYVGQDSPERARS